MSRSATFSVNGRFLTQPVTGVQRYARNVLVNLDAILVEGGEEAPIIAPRGAPDPALAALLLRTAGPLSGHAWEQLVLPSQTQGRLLNLCNTAPAVKTDQVVCIHDANVFNAPEAYSSGFRALYKTLQPFFAQRATRITTVSAFSAREIARHLSVDSRRIAILPNGHEHALAWDPAHACIKLATSGDRAARPFVLALGSRARHKNLKLLLDLAPELAALGVDILVVGGGSSIFAAEPLALAANVTTIGYVSDHDLAYLMERALCLAFPSWTEGFGLPVVEAMARGCPVVASNRASLPEVCGEAVLMAAPDDPAGWVNNVSAILGSAELRTDLIGRGRERARLFSWRETAAGYADLLQHPERSSPAAPRSRIQALPRVGVVIATTRRPEIVAATVNRLLVGQTLPPVTMIVSCVAREDAGELAGRKDVTIVTGRPGLAAQRNRALRAMPTGVEIIAFFDDDFVADSDWIATAACTFQDRPEVVGFTGHLLADGIKGPGLSFEEAIRLLNETVSPPQRSFIEPYSPYGCNMAFRASAIGNLQFDERLVLYGWLEDRDFGAALAQRGGLLVKCANARGVHMGVKGGRVAGDRLGYSQVINPLYLLRKGTMSLAQVADHLLRNLVSNAVRSAKPEPFIDRRGRLKGNLLGLTDVLRGRLEPERASALGQRQRGSK